MTTEQTIKPEQARRRSAATGRRPERHGRAHRPDTTSCRSRTARSAPPHLRQIKVSEDDFGLMSYDPAFLNTASCRSAITWIDGDKGELWHRGIPIEQLCEQQQLPRGRLPADLRRAADEGAARRVGATTSRSTPSCTRTSRSSWRASATTRTRWACCSRRSARCRPSIPDAKKIDDKHERYMATIRMIAKMPTLAAFAYRHNLGLPVRLSGQRPRLPGQLPLDDVQDDRAQVRAGPAARAGARRALDPARRPRAELLHERGAQRRLLAGRPVLGGRGRRRGALRAAARRRERGGAEDARPDRERRTTSPASSRA